MSPLFHHPTTHERSIDDFLIHDRDASFMLTVEGDAWIDDGIYAGDMIIVERGRTPRTRDLVLTVTEGTFTLATYSSVTSRQEADGPTTIEAVVTAVIRKLIP
ncbi:MAG: S24 family peptidase [Patescibacteria group bacterium]